MPDLEPMEILRKPVETFGDGSVEHYLHERYRQAGKSSRLVSLYYRFRPIMPRGVQLALRRRYARFQSRVKFPSWPIEPILVDRQNRDMALRIRQSADGRVPLINFWPGDARSAVVLTHDVETAKGVANIARLRKVEEKYGLFSSWNFVPERYPFDKSMLKKLTDDGCEIGVHGLYHDGKLFSSHETFKKRVPQINSYLQSWGAVGFRSPATHRNPDWMPMITAEYDSSFPDTDPFEPQAGGCCSIFPWFLGHLVELPITMPQDHTLIEILQERDISCWTRKATWLIENHGLVLLIVHPDYMLAERNMKMYDEFLGFITSTSDLWFALPKEVARWWRDRVASQVVELPGGGFGIEGPASDRARIAWATLKGNDVMYSIDKKNITHLTQCDNDKEPISESSIR